MRIAGALSEIGVPRSEVGIALLMFNVGVETGQLLFIAAVLLAVLGVLLLAGVEADGEMIGVVFALLAGVAWAGYIVLGHRVARTGLAVDGLGVGMLGFVIKLVIQYMMEQGGI